MKKEAKKKLKLAAELLAEESTSLEKLEKIGKLLKGVNPKIDGELAAAVRLAGKINKIAGGDVLGLSLEKLPEKTKKDKKRKKLMVLFLSRWRKLKGEVKRISGPEEGEDGREGKEGKGGSKAGKAVRTVKILATMKGPMGIITIAAAAIVAAGAALNSSAVEIRVTNRGCRPLGPVREGAINLPGLKVPEGAIVSGSEGVVRVPGLKMRVGLYPGRANLGVLNLSKSFGMPGEIREVVYDGRTMMGGESEVDLGSSKKHEVIVDCTGKN